MTPEKIDRLIEAVRAVIAKTYIPASAPQVPIGRPLIATEYDEIKELYDALAALDKRGDAVERSAGAAPAVSAEPEIIECVKTVGIDPTYPAAALYRVTIGRRCFDFVDEQEAKNLITAIRELMTAPARLTESDIEDMAIAYYTRIYRLGDKGRASFIGLSRETQQELKEACKSALKIIMPIIEAAPLTPEKKRDKDGRSTD